MAIALSYPEVGQMKFLVNYLYSSKENDVIYSPGGIVLFGITSLEVAYLHAELSESGQVPWLGVILSECRFDVPRLIPLRHLRVHVGRTALSHLQCHMASQA